MKKSLKLCLGLSGLIGLSTATLWYYVDGWSDTEFILTHGNVDIRQVDLGFRVSGRLKGMLVEEGEEVKAGQLVALLDDEPYRNEERFAYAQVMQAQATLDKRKTGNRPEEILQAESIMREKQATYENAERVFKRQERLLKSGNTSQQAYDNAQQQLRESAARLKNAQESLQLVKEGFRKEDIQEAEAALAQAKAKWEGAKTNLADTQLKSPSQGIVLSRIREPGTIVNTGATVYVLSLNRHIWVRSYVSEKDLGKIKPGGEALIHMDSYEIPLKGTIGFISPQAEFTPKNVETKELRADLVYRLRILVDDPQGFLRQGMPVTVKLKK